MVTKALMGFSMRRSLVLSNEKARHPFRASLPMHVFEPLAGSPQHEPEVLAAMNGKDAPSHDIWAKDAKLDWWRLTRSDVRGFVSTYLAVFLAVLVFIM